MLVLRRKAFEGNHAIHVPSPWKQNGLYTTIKIPRMIHARKKMCFLNSSLCSATFQQC